MQTSNRHWFLSFAFLVACASEDGVGERGLQEKDASAGGSAGSGAGGGAGRGTGGTSGGGTSGGGTSGGSSGGTSAGGAVTGGANAGGAGNRSSGGSSGSSGGAATGGAQNGSYLACANPKALVLGGTDTGYVTCDGAVVHRKAIVDCPNLLPRSNGGTCQNTGPGIAADPCTKDADCTKRSNGYCAVGPTSHYPACQCFYGCLKDTDCAGGNICVCGDPVGTCRPAACTDDGACPTGSLCASAALSWGGCSFYGVAVGFRCQATGDVCFSDQQCASPTPACAFDADAGIRGCHQGQLACP